MSLVYNNKKLIGKCSKFAIEKVQCTSPFVMLENFEPKQPQLNENQQIVLEWLKEYMLDDSDFYNTVYASKQLYSYGVPYGEESEAFTKLNNRELAQVLELFSKWAQEQEEE